MQTCKKNLQKNSTLHVYLFVLKAPIFVEFTFAWEWKLFGPLFGRLSSPTKPHWLSPYPDPLLWTPPGVSHRPWGGGSSQLKGSRSWRMSNPPASETTALMWVHAPPGRQIVEGHSVCRHQAPETQKKKTPSIYEKGRRKHFWWVSNKCTGP